MTPGRVVRGAALSTESLTTETLQLIFSPHRRVHLFGGDREITDSYPHRVFDGVGDGRRDRSNRVFADASDFVRADTVLAEARQ